MIFHLCILTHPHINYSQIMKKTILYSIISVLLFSIACNKKHESSADDDKRLSDDIIPIKVNRSLYVEKYSNIFKNVQYVPLEETRNSIVGAVSSLQITNSGDFIVFDNKLKAVFRFASDGKFLNNIGFRGPGENEYVLPMDVKYDSFYDKVLVWDNGKRSILTYGMDGKVEYQIQLPWFIYSIGIVDKDYLICYMNNSEDIRGSEKGTNYKIIRRDGTIIREFGEYGVEKSRFRPSTDHSFCFQLGRCLCFPPFSSTLYCVENTSLKPLVTFDLSEKAVPQEWLKGNYFDFRENIRKRPDLVEIISCHETDRYYVLNMIKSGPALLCIINKETREVKNLSSYSINDIYGMAESTIVTSVHDNKIYFATESMDYGFRMNLLESVSEGASIKDVYLKQEVAIRSQLDHVFGENSSGIYIDSLKTTKYNLIHGERDLIEKLASHNNPIIQICTLK